MTGWRPVQGCLMVAGIGSPPPPRPRGSDKDKWKRMDGWVDKFISKRSEKIICKKLDA